MTHPGEPLFTMRFDMRLPLDDAPAVDLYQAALDMTAWTETRGRSSPS